MADQPSQSTGAHALRLRIISGLVMILVALGLTWAGGWAFLLLVALLSALMLYEWDVICGGKALGATFWLQALLVWAALAGMALGQTQRGVALVLIGLPVVMFFGRRFKGGLLWAPLGLLYVAIPALAILWLRRLLSDGFEVTIWVFALIWATDIGGYAAGRSIGGPKLAPAISPNKTWAGLGGAMALAAATSVGLGILFGFAPTWVCMALAGAVLAVWGQIGDLAESAFKRRFGVKDSGAIIPGHGGILDRLDGFVFVAPVVTLALWHLGSAILIGG